MTAGRISQVPRVLEHVTEEHRKYQRDWVRARRAADPEYRQRHRDGVRRGERVRTASDPGFREYKRVRQRRWVAERRKHDPALRVSEARVKAGRRAQVRMVEAGVLL